METPVDDLIAASGPPSPAAALAPAAAVASEIAVPTEGAVRDATNVLATLLPAAVSGQPARPKLAAAPLPLALGDEIPALPLTASATALANTSAPGKGIAQLFERIAARLNTSSAAGQGTATALPASLGAEIATSLTGNGLPSAVAAAVREWLGDGQGAPRPAGEPLAFGSILNVSADAAAGVAQAKAATLSHQAQLGKSAALQVAVQITRAAQEGVSHISIRLHPAELGRVDVRLEVAHDGRVIATISAERAETLDLLQRDSRDIERLLQNAGLSADAGSLSFSLRGDETEEQAGTATTGEPADAEDDPDADSAAAHIALGDGSGQHALNILV